MSDSLGNWSPYDARCSICVGPAGNDSMRCERLALPLHRTHLVAGIYYLPGNTDDLNAGLMDAWQSAITGSERTV